MNNSETLDFYSKEISKISLLDSATEHSLIIAASNGDISARNKLVSCNLRLVMKIAAQFKNSYIQLEDLIFEGNLGLIHAAEKVDSNHQNKYDDPQFLAGCHTQGVAGKISVNKGVESKNWQKHVGRKHFYAGNSLVGNKVF